MLSTFFPRAGGDISRSRSWAQSWVASPVGLTNTSHVAISTIRVENGRPHCGVLQGTCNRRKRHSSPPPVFLCLF
jgi:hypothetical protein